MSPVRTAHPRSQQVQEVFEGIVAPRQWPQHRSGVNFGAMLVPAFHIKTFIYPSFSSTSRFPFRSIRWGKVMGV